MAEQISPRSSLALLGAANNSAEARALERLRFGKATPTELARADQALIASAYQIAAEAQSRLLEHVTSGQATQAELQKAADTSLKTIAAYRRWNAATSDTGESGAGSKLLDRLEHMLSSGTTVSLTVSQRPPDQDALDVTPISSDSSE